MEDSEDFQLVTHLKKGIFQQLTRKKKIKQILSEKRNKFQYFGANNSYQQHQNQVQDPCIDLQNRFEDTDQIQRQVQYINAQIQQGNEQVIEHVSNNYPLLERVVLILREIVQQNEYIDDLGDNQICTKNEIIVLDILNYLINLTYYRYLNDNLFDYLIKTLFSPLKNSYDMIQEQTKISYERNLIEFIAFKYSSKNQVLEYLVSILNNVVFQENQELHRAILQSKTLFNTLADIMQNKQHSNQLINDVSHFLYNLTRQKGSYEFSDMEDVLYIVYLMLPLSNDKTLVLNRILQALSSTLDKASSQEFIDFSVLNHHIFDLLSLTVGSQTNKQSLSDVKDEESIQIILEIFLLSSDVLCDEESEGTKESSHIIKLIWMASQSIFNIQFNNPEILILSLKIFNTILENAGDSEYFIRNLLDKDENVNLSNPNALKDIIIQCCEWNNKEIVNEFISLLCHLANKAITQIQLSRLLNSGVIFIFMESFKSDLLFYETQDQILETLFNIINEQYNLEGDQEISSSMLNFVMMNIQQCQGQQILENLLNQQITQRTQSMIECLLDDLQSNQIME